MNATKRRTLPLLALLIAAARGVPAQEPAAAPKPTEGPIIIHLPSAEVPRDGTLTLFFTHRFSQPLARSDFHSLYSFDSGADIGIGLSYAPLPHADVGFYRSSNLDVYEVVGKYQFLSEGKIRVAGRAGGDFRTEKNLDRDPGYKRNGFFAQGIVAAVFFSRARITVVPTYVSATSEQIFTTPKSSYKNVFTVPVALSAGITRSINVQAEVYPRLSRIDSQGVGWTAAIEKTVLGHRFAFTVGNVRTTTVDQYVASVPFQVNPHDYYIGFNLVRQWKLK
jgi:hypothetical protein